MAADFEVLGPVAVFTDVVLADTFVLLGFVRNENLISYEMEHFNQEVTSSRGGDEPLEIIHRGQVGFLDFLLEEFDESELAALDEQVPGLADSDDGKAGTIGARWIGDSRTFAVRITPTDRLGVAITPTVLKPSFTFGTCYIPAGRSIGRSDMGAQSTKASVSIKALRDPSTDVIYTRATS